MSYPGYSLGRVLPILQRYSRYILQPQPTRQLQVLSTLQQTRVIWRFSTRKGALWCNSLLQKRHAVLLGIHARNAITEISQWLIINLRPNLYSLSLRISRLLTSSSLLYSKRFGRYVLRPSSDVSYRTRELTQPRSEPFIYSTGVDCSNSIDHDRVRVLSYSKYSPLFLLVVGTEAITSR